MEERSKQAPRLYSHASCASRRDARGDGTGRPRSPRAREVGRARQGEVPGYPRGRSRGARRGPGIPARSGEVPGYPRGRSLPAWRDPRRPVRSVAAGTTRSRHVRECGHAPRRRFALSRNTSLWRFATCEAHPEMATPSISASEIEGIGGRTRGRRAPKSSVCTFLANPPKVLARDVYRSRGWASARMPASFAARGLHAVPGPLRPPEHLRDAARCAHEHEHP